MADRFKDNHADKATVHPKNLEQVGSYAPVPSSDQEFNHGHIQNMPELEKITPPPICGGDGAKHSLK